MKNGIYIAALLSLAACVASWVTHVLIAIQNEQWIFLIVGAFFPPIGVIHGFAVWLGFFG